MRARAGRRTSSSADADATRSYKVVNTEDWSDNGYWRAIGEEIAT
jgi:hypothetical protein